VNLDSTILLIPKPPWILWFGGPLTDSLSAEELLAESGVTARVLRGKRMRTKHDLFEEFAVHLSFPDYFGGNWDALADCLEDLEWLQGLAYTVVIDGAHEVLVDEPPEQLNLFVQLIDRVAASWAEPVTLGEDWDRPAVPFHWVLHDSPEGRTSLQTRLGSVIPADISLEP